MGTTSNAVSKCVKRNDYMTDNYKIIMKVCLKYAHGLSRKFPDVSVGDLVEYGLEGAIIALDNADMTCPRWKNYVRKYIYMNMLTGVQEMCGFHRTRSQNVDSDICLISFDPVELELISDEYQEKCEDYCERLNTLSEEYDMKQLFKTVRESQEYIILWLLLNNYTIQQIYSVFRYRRYYVAKAVEYIRKAFDLAFSNQPFAHLFTKITPEQLAEFRRIILEYFPNRKIFFDEPMIRP